MWAADRSEPLISQIPQSLLANCLEVLPQDGSITATFVQGKARVLRKTAGQYCAIAFATDQDHIKSKKLMESEVDAILSAAPTIDSAVQRAEVRTRRLLHNLKSLTAKTSQEIFALAQQDKLIGNPREMVPYLASEVRENIDGTARALLEILKHQSAQKAEYTAFDRLTGKFDISGTEIHNVHQVLMNVFYLFFGEFISKRVKAEVERTRAHAKIDYDSIHVCIYYIVENAAKYTRPGSDFTVAAVEDKTGFVDPC